MLSDALTCPLWWVARWSSRMLTSFAMAVALSLGGPALPDGVVSADRAASAVGVEACGVAVTEAGSAAVDAASDGVRWQARTVDVAPSPAPVGRPAAAPTAPRSLRCGPPLAPLGPRAPPVA